MTVKDMAHSIGHIVAERDAERRFPHKVDGRQRVIPRQPIWGKGLPGKLKQMTWTQLGGAALGRDAHCARHSLSRPLSPALIFIIGLAGAETWHRILNAIERLQAKAPAEGEKVH
jgi:hypothetical protein